MCSVRWCPTNSTTALAFLEDFFLVRAEENMRTVGNGPSEVSHFYLELSALVRRGA